jgi:FkbM family methyltransferase
LGLPDSHALAEAVENCRYELWPPILISGGAWKLVDIGANTGAFLKAAAQLSSLAGVYAFEPLASCRQSLEAELNRIPNSRLFAVAAGSRNGEVELNVTTDHKMCSVLRPRREIAKHYCPGAFEVTANPKIPVVRLDDVLPPSEEFGLLKIDVQGYEKEVLAGARSVLSRTRAVLLEVNYVAHYEGGFAFDEALEMMRSLNYTTYGVSAPFVSDGRPLWADAMFVHN